jgi:preprotein translocase subunit YajC
MDFAIFLVIVAVIAFFVWRNNKKDSTSTTVTTTAGVSADRNGDKVVSKAELKKLTKVQLVQMAEKRSLSVKKSGTKADLINEIHSQLK